MVKVAFFSVHSRRLWKWRSAVYMIAVCGSGVLQCTYSPFVKVKMDIFFLDFYLSRK